MTEIINNVKVYCGYSSVNGHTYNYGIGFGGSDEDEFGYHSSVSASFITFLCMEYRKSNRKNVSTCFLPMRIWMRKMFCHF